jgi:DNA-binding HxlR family transcriptional regulator
VTVSIEVNDLNTREIANPVLAGLFTGGVLSASCPSRVVLDHVTSKWGVLVLVALSDRTMRWGELRRVVEGISEKMLASTLRTLEQDGLVLREATPSGGLLAHPARRGAVRPAAAADGVGGRPRGRDRGRSLTILHRTCPPRQGPAQAAVLH